MKHFEDYERYQHQPWYIKLWRRRFYLKAYYYWLVGLHHTDAIDSEHKMPWKRYQRFRWDMEIGSAQFEMGYYYTLDEVKEKEKNRGSLGNS
jgi:hypothetical protein